MPGMDMPMKGADEGSVDGEDAERTRVKGNGRVGDDAHRHGVRVIDRPGRGRRVVVRLLRCVLRLHYLGASVRARRGRKSRNCQCNDNQFLTHDRYPPVVFGLNLLLGAKLQTSRADASDASRVICYSLMVIRCGSASTLYLDFRSAHTTVSGPSKIVRLMTSARATEKERRGQSSLLTQAQEQSSWLSVNG